MRYLCAPDSFKESLTAAEAARAMAEGIRRGDPDAEIRCLPMADGGEGTARALADATGGTMLTAGAHDPLGRPVQAGFALLGDGRTAVVETAAPPRPKRGPGSSSCRSPTNSTTPPSNTCSATCVSQSRAIFQSTSPTKAISASIWS